MAPTATVTVPPTAPAVSLMGAGTERYGRAMQVHLPFPTGKDKAFECGNLCLWHLLINKRPIMRGRTRAGTRHVDRRFCLWFFNAFTWCAHTHLRSHLLKCRQDEIRDTSAERACNNIR